MNSHQNRIYVIIPVHNRKIFTRDCLLSLSNQTYKNFTIVVVDDGSSDGTSEMIQKEFSEVVLLRGDGNLWWTAAINHGVKYSLKNSANYIMTMNDDTIATENLIEKMVFWSEKKPIALLGAFELDAETKKPVYGGEIVSWKTTLSTDLLNLLALNERCGLHRVTHFPGRGLFIPSQVFREIGLFDAKHLPHYAADYDFTHRAIRSGYDIYCNYDAKLLVYTSASGDFQLRNNKTLKNYYNHVFGRKGGGNLKTFIVYALKNCPPMLLPSYLIIGIIRRMFGYGFHWTIDIYKERMNTPSQE